MESKFSSSKDLPLEILTDILIRVESKSLLRFRCVSKTWVHIIDDHTFCVQQFRFRKNYYEMNNEDITIITAEDKNNSSFGSKFRLQCCSRELLSCAAEVRPPCTSVLQFSHMVLGCVHGLFLLGLCQYYILWNPFTRKSLALPMHPLFLNPLDREYEESHAQYCLGFDTCVGDFKLVALRPDLSNIGVFSCVTGCWKTCRFDFKNNWMANLKLDECHRCVSVMGAVNWLGYDAVLKEFTHIVSFELSSEKFEFFKLPDDDDGDYKGLRFPFALGRGRKANLWTKWYSNDLPEVDIGRYEFFKRVSKAIYYNLLFHEKSRKFLVAVDGRVFSYDIETHERQYMKKSDNLCINYIAFYGESLALCGKGVTGSLGQILHSVW